MGKIKGSYTLTELCGEIDLSTSWIKKIEKHLGLSSWGSGLKGKKSYYSEHQFDFFKKISILRFLGYGLEDIKELFDTEMKILNIAMENYSIDDGKEDGVKITNVDLYLISNIYCGPSGVDIDAGKLESDKGAGHQIAKEFDELVNEYKRSIEKIVAVFKKKYKFLGEELKFLESWIR